MARARDGEQAAARERRAKRCSRRRSTRRSGELPAPAPDFTLKDYAGREVKLSSLRGQVVLVNFWATWCPTCVVEMPSMEQLVEHMKRQAVPPARGQRRRRLAGDPQVLRQGHAARRACSTPRARCRQAVRHREVSRVVPRRQGRQHSLLRRQRSRLERAGSRRRASTRCSTEGSASPLALGTSRPRSARRYPTAWRPIEEPPRKPHRLRVHHRHRRIAGDERAAASRKSGLHLDRFSRCDE